MANLMRRYWERMESRAKIGGRALYETRLRAKKWYGEGGVELTDAEVIELGDRAAADSTGQMFEDALRNRQKANNMEGSKELPEDWGVWAEGVQERRQAQGGE